MHTYDIPKAKICNVEGCERTIRCKQLCHRHYERWRTGRSTDVSRDYGGRGGTCSEEGCDNPIHAKRFCSKHYEYHTRSKQCVECGERRDRRSRSGKCYNCQPKQRYQRDGYVYLWLPDHPNKNSSGYVYEHRVVMEIIIGRFLLPTENVHHKNGVRNDNSPENLELWTKSQPPGVRAIDILAWARKVVALYSPIEDKI